MPQLSKGGKFIFGKSIVREDGAVQIARKGYPALLIVLTSIQCRFSINPQYSTFRRCEIQTDGCIIELY